MSGNRGQIATIGRPLTRGDGFPICRALTYTKRTDPRESIAVPRHQRIAGPRGRPPSLDGLTRFLGGSPLAVAFRLVLLSILVGVVLAAIGFDPWNIIRSVQLLFQRLWDLGFDAVNWLWRYFLLGAVIVIPIWLLSRLFGAPRGR